LLGGKRPGRRRGEELVEIGRKLIVVGVGSGNEGVFEQL